MKPAKASQVDKVLDGFLSNTMQKDNTAQELGTVTVAAMSLFDVRAAASAEGRVRFYE